MKKIRKNYSLEFKIQAVSLSEHRGNVSLVAQELGICKELLRVRKELEEKNRTRHRKKAVGIFSKRDG